jgi:hypothetical protein
MEENVPKWDEKTCFHRRARSAHGGSNDLTLLEAQVYNSMSLLGTVSLSDVYFDRHSDNVVAIRRPWNVTAATSSSSVPHANGGALLLKVYLASAYEVQLHIFDIKYAIEDRPKGTNVDQNPPIALRPADAVPRMITPNFEPGRVVERMQHLFVRVVKARRLPHVDANGSLDPYVEVTFGASNMGVTKCLKRNNNPEWNETFAFSYQPGKAPSSSVDVVVNDKDLVRDDFVGKLCFDVTKIPERSPDDIPLEPTWYPLFDQEGRKKLAHASLLLAIWTGSQSDEAYRHAWVSQYSPKVYETPRLWCLRVTVFQAQGITVADGMADSTMVSCKACLGDQTQVTRTKATRMARGIYSWKEDLLFVAAEPFFEGDLVVSVIAKAGNDEIIIGTCTIPLPSIDKRADGDHLIEPKLFDLERSSAAAPPLLDDGSVDESNGNGHMKIALRNLLEGGYHIGHDSSQGYIDDPRPADRKLWEPPIGSVHLGILRTVGLTHSNASDGRSTLNPYCVAKYGDKWVRTRTAIDSPDHVFNEQYTFDVYDITTVLSVGVFDHCMLKGSVHRNIGKVVRIHLPCLETERIYAHSYPLVILTSSGAMKTGELHLAVKISLPSSVNMIRMYVQPTLPRMHYVQPLTEVGVVKTELSSQAVKILALRLGQMEPPLRREIVECICQREAYLWSFRKMKANFDRLMGIVSPFIDFFKGVCSWRKPAVTLLAHAIFAFAMLFPKVALLLVFLCGALAAVWNYRLRPSYPYSLSLLYTTHPDEMDEELDTFPTTSSEELIRMRYDRLRHVSGKVQTTVGDFASLGERIQSLLSWRDPRATAIFIFFIVMIQVTAYFVQFKVLATAAGFYAMRHPRLRTNTPSIFLNFFERLPTKQDSFF